MIENNNFHPELFVWGFYKFHSWATTNPEQQD